MPAQAPQSPNGGDTSVERLTSLDAKLPLVRGTAKLVRANERALKIILEIGLAVWAITNFAGLVNKDAAHFFSSGFSKLEQAVR